MSLTANDIRGFEFRVQMRGYDREEVDNLLEQVAVALETAKQETVKLSMELDSLRAQVANLKQNEEVIKNAAIDARRNADLTITNAKKEALELLNKANEDGARLIAAKADKVKEIEDQIRKLDQTRKEYLGKLRNLISSHLDIAEKEALSDAREVLAEVSDASESPESITVTESEDVTTQQRETIVGTPIGDDDNDSDDRTDVPEGLRTTVSEGVQEEGDDSPTERGELVEEPEEPDPELTEALKQYQELKGKGAIQEDDQPTPTPSLASPDTKWSETTSRAEEVPPEFIVQNNTGEPIQQTPPPPPPVSSNEKPSMSDSQPMEPNPLESEETPEPAQQETREPAPPPPVKPNQTGKVDISKEFDEIAAKFNEEMNKADDKE